MSNLKIQINVDSPSSIYQQIADGIKEKIHKKELKPGERIPSEKELSDTLSVARGTVRKAISELVKNDILEKVQGKGTFVKQNKISVPFASELISYAESMKAKGLQFTTHVLICKKITVPEKIRKQLKLAKNDKILYLERLREVEGEPAILLYNWVSLKRCPGIEDVDYNQEPLFSAIEQISNVKIKYGVRNFSAKNLNRQQAELMHVAVDSAVLNINQLSFNEKDEPIEYSDALLRTDQYEVTSVLYR